MKDEAFKEMVVKAGQERCSSRGVAGIFGIIHQTALNRIKNWITSEHITALEPAKEDDVLELDEMWSFVQRKSFKRWIRIALCRAEHVKQQLIMLATVV